MPATVCIIDDDELVLAQMARTLREGGLEVHEAPTAREGLALIDQIDPDVALLDMIMPEQDGIETLTALRRAHPDLPVFAISGGGQIGASIYLELARTLGAAACLSKPLSLEDFEAAMARAGARVAKA
jgi:CheY-like chemotaxis protein